MEKQHTREKPDSGFTLLETMLALAILGGAMAIIGEVSRLGVRNAISARELTQAQLLADSIMAELQLGIRTLDPVTDSAISSDEFVDSSASESDLSSDLSSDAIWLYSIDVTTLDDYGLTAVAVTVKRNVTSLRKPTSVRLVRWIVDPNFSEESEETTSTTN